MQFNSSVFSQACRLIVSLLWLTERTAFRLVLFHFDETRKFEPLLTDGGGARRTVRHCLQLLKIKTGKFAAPNLVPDHRQ